MPTTFATMHVFLLDCQGWRWNPRPHRSSITKPQKMSNKLIVEWKKEERKNSWIERLSDLPKDTQLLCEDAQVSVYSSREREEIWNEGRGGAYLESLGGCAQGPHRG